MVHFTVQSKIICPWSHEARLPKVLVSKRDASLLREKSENLRIAVKSRGIFGVIFGVIRIRAQEDFPVGTKILASESNLLSFQINYKKSWPIISFGATSECIKKTNFLFVGRCPLNNSITVELNCEKDAAALKQPFAELVPVPGVVDGARPKNRHIEEIWDAVSSLTASSSDIEIDRQWRDLMASDRCKNSREHFLWLKSAILVDALKSRNYRLNRNRLRKLRQLLAGESELGNFNEILAYINTKISPVIIGPHGYRVAPSQVNQHELFAELSEMMNFLKERGYPAFLNSGTLLGLHRDGQLIPHDDDLDIGVYFGDCSIDELVEENSSLLAEVEKRYSFIFKGLGAFGAVKLKSGVEVDIFPAWSSGDKFYVYPYMFGELDKSEVIPLSKAPYFGSELDIPKGVESILAVNYGESWKNPDPMWKFDWRGSKKRFHEFLGAQAEFNKRKETAGT